MSRIVSGTSAGGVFRAHVPRAPRRNFLLALTSAQYLGPDGTASDSAPGLDRARGHSRAASPYGRIAARWRRKRNTPGLAFEVAESMLSRLRHLPAIPESAEFPAAAPRRSSGSPRTRRYLRGSPAGRPVGPLAREHTAPAERLAACRSQAPGHRCQPCPDYHSAILKLKLTCRPASRAAIPPRRKHVGTPT